MVDHLAAKGLFSSVSRDQKQRKVTWIHHTERNPNKFRRCSLIEEYANEQLI